MKVCLRDVRFAPKSGDIKSVSNGSHAPVAARVQTNESTGAYCCKQSNHTRRLYRLFESPIIENLPGVVAEKGTRRFRVYSAPRPHVHRTGAQRTSATSPKASRVRTDAKAATAATLKVEARPRETRRGDIARRNE
jgi:hypothetical protein